MVGYKEITHLGCECLVNQDGDVYTKNGKNEYVHREWYKNADYYAVVAACGWDSLSIYERHRFGTEKTVKKRCKEWAREAVQAF